MGARREARECALQILYSMDVCRLTPQEAKEAFWRENIHAEEVRQFAETLVDGASNNLKTIDDLIRPIAQNWEIERMAAIDRNLLRQAGFELLYLADIPVNVVINEAIELAKKFSTEDSGKFVNGILDKMKDFRGKG